MMILKEKLFYLLLKSTMVNKNQVQTFELDNDINVCVNYLRENCESNYRDNAETIFVTRGTDDTQMALALTLLIY